MAGYDPNDIMNFGLGGGASNPTASYMKTAQAAPATTPRWGAAPLAGTKGVTPAGGGALGFNLDTAGLALGGVQTIGSLWQAWEANKLAKDQFRIGTKFANTNLANSIQSYNTTLEDRTRARAFTEGQTSEQAQAYNDANRLKFAAIK